MKDGIPFGVLLAVGFIGYWVGKKIGHYEAAVNFSTEILRIREAKEQPSASHQEHTV